MEASLASISTGKHNHMIKNIPYPDEAALLADVQAAMPNTFGSAGDQEQQAIAMVHRLCEIYAHTLHRHRAGDTQAIHKTHEYLEAAAQQQLLVVNGTNAGIVLAMTGLRLRLDEWFHKNIADDI